MPGPFPHGVVIEDELRSTRSRLSSCAGHQARLLEKSYAHLIRTLPGARRPLSGFSAAC